MDMQGRVTGQRGMARVALCVALSLVLHVGVVWGMLALLAGGYGGARRALPQGERSVERMLQIVLPPEQERVFAKTDPDLPEVAPREADFIGKRNAVASDSEFRPDRHSDAPVPTQNGEEREDLTTFDQERQEGDLAHDGRRELPQPPAPPAPPGAPTPPDPVQMSPAEEVIDTPTPDGMVSVQPPPPGTEGDVRPEEAAESAERPMQPTPQSAYPTEALLTRQASPGLPLYDPTLADHMQQAPGFRTHERRTRSTGRFVIGSKPSLNVAATPQGRYEEEVYRRIAYSWYMACDEHRGDIIPGSVVVSLRVNKRGLLENMDLIQRRGASVIQQSFTFGAIRRASLPPMPPAVQQEMVGDLLELIFRFHFD